MVRETSLKCYNEIKEEGKYDTDMEMVYDAINNYPLMTGREYATIILGYDDMNKVRPRISDLKSDGAIIEVGKRECSCSKRTSYVWATLEGVEKLTLKKVGFKESQTNLFTFKEDDIICCQDFRKGKRRSYAFSEANQTADYKHLECYKKFKEELANLINKEDH